MSANCPPLPRRLAELAHAHCPPWHSHSHVTDDVLSDRRHQEGSQDLQGVQEGVRLVVMVPTAVAAAEVGSRG